MQGIRGLNYFSYRLIQAAEKESYMMKECDLVAGEWLCIHFHAHAIHLSLRNLSKSLGKAFSIIQQQYNHQK